MGASGEISVIIPAYNAAEFLAEGIRSVLSQDSPPGELIVVDDGSSDDTASVAKSFGSAIRLLSQSNAGPGAARNLGVRNTRGTMLAFLDADDLWLPGKLTSQLSAFEDNPALSMVFGRVEIVQASGESAEPAIYEGLHAGAMLIRRDAFLDVGYFPTGLCAGEFMDWFARARDLGLLSKVLPEVVMRRRLHDKNLTRMDESKLRSAYFDVIRNALNRRNEAAASSHQEKQK